MFTTFTQRSVGLKYSRGQTAYVNIISEALKRENSRFAANVAEGDMGLDGEHACRQLTHLQKSRVVEPQSENEDETAEDSGRAT